LWETKVLQSKATEDFFRNSVHSPLFTLQLPHSLHQTLQSSAGWIQLVNYHHCHVIIDKKIRLFKLLNYFFL
ncbi:hypothetical protein FD755_007780, partial [Muntiacus reevesi]